MQFHKDGTVPNENGIIFVFGSNLAGIHGAGAAREAYKNYGAVLGRGVGLHGSSYAIPTKNFRIESMSLDTIRHMVLDFVEFSKRNPQINFFVTRIGCGLANNKDSEVAPMFKGVGDNCNMPENWRQYLVKEK